MAKSNLSWDLDKHTLTVTVLATKAKITFDLTKIFSDFDKLKDVQQKLIAYGTKQKLADKVAKPSDEKLTPSEMQVELKALWERLVDNVWRIEGEAKSTMKKKVDEAKSKATPEELEVLQKLGLV